MTVAREIFCRDLAMGTSRLMRILSMDGVMLTLPILIPPG